MFVLSTVPLPLILRGVNACYEWGKKEYKLNYLLFVDDLKLFSKIEEQMGTLVRTVHVLSTDIGMELGMKICGILTMKRRKSRNLINLGNLSALNLNLLLQTKF